MLEVKALSARYGAVIAVRSIDLSVATGNIVALVGPNGAGKSTALRSIMGQHLEQEGSVVVDDTDVSQRGAVIASRSGLAIVPQGRRLFATLTVEEHYMLSGSRASDDAMRPEEIEEFFPGLARRRSVRSASLSGGEQQMLAIARAVLTGPRYILMDEPTEGLAPSIVENVAAMVQHLPRRGIGVLITDEHNGPLTHTADELIHIDRGSIELQADNGNQEATT